MHFFSSVFDILLSANKVVLLAVKVAIVGPAPLRLVTFQGYQPYPNVEVVVVRRPRYSREEGVYTICCTLATSRPAEDNLPI